MMHGFGSRLNRRRARAERFDFVQQRLRDDAFAVIADDDCIGVFQFLIF